MFSMPGAAGIGVPCGPESDIICFDLDYGHTEDEDRKRALDEWWTRWEKVIDSGDVMIRQTRSGGYHILMSWPRGARPPRRIMPKLDVITEGFYFVWWMEDDSYRHVSGELTELEPPAGMLEIVERDTMGSGAALMSPEDAHEAMWSNGDAGIRHDALLRMTHDWVQEFPDAKLKDLCRGFEDWFRDIYGDRIEAARLDKLLEWDVEGERGELYRAFAGAKKRAPIGEELLAAAARKYAERQGRPTVAQVAAATAAVQQQEITKSELSSSFYMIDGDETLRTELPSIEYIIPQVMPRASLCSWAGPSGAGKTRYMALLLACLMTGRTDIMGMPRATRPVTTLYVANEERELDMHRRIKAAMVANGLSGGKPIYIRGKDKGRFTMTRSSSDGKSVVRNDELLDALVEQVKALDIELIVFDPFVTLGSGGESDPGNIDEVNSFMVELSSRTGAVAGHIHHTPKDRGAPPDAERGLDGAWRGHGSIYSALDQGETIFPLLPSEVSKDRKLRLKLRDLEAAGHVGRYVVIDTVKMREGKALPPRAFQMTEVPVNKEGQMIGVLVPAGDVAEIEELLLDAVKNASLNEVTRMKLEWAVRLFEMVQGQTGTVTLDSIHKHMKAEKAVGWSDAERIEGRSGFGAKFFKLMSIPTTVNGKSLSVHNGGRAGVTITISEAS